MLQWPDPLPDETLYSLIARLAKINGTPSALALCSVLASHPAISVMDCQLSLDALCSGGHGLPAGAQRMLAEMTSIGASGHLAEIEAEAFADVMSGQRLVGLTQAAIGGLCRWKICLSCVESDLARFGIAYWHRQHQLPASLLCAEHGDVLSRFDIGKAKAHECFFLPMDLTGYPSISPSAKIFEQREFWLGLATLGAEALNDKEVPHPHHVVLRSFKMGMHQSGFLTRNGLLRRKSVVDSFEQKLGGICSKDVLPRADVVAGPVSLLCGIENSRECRPLSRLLLVYWLFGSWGAFKERCQWEDILDSDNNFASLSEAKLQAVGDLLSRYRAICVDYMASVENPTRASFQKAHQKSHRSLLNNDRQWFEKELPVPQSRKAQRDLFS